MSGVGKSKIQRDEAGMKWIHQKEEKSVREGRGKQAAKFL